MSSPENDLLWEMTAQTLGTETLAKNYYEIVKTINAHEQRQEDRVRKAIVAAYLSTPAEIRGKLDINAAIEKFAGDVISKASEFDSRQHPRNIYGRFVRSLRLDSPQMRNQFAQFRIIEDLEAGQGTPKGFRIVHDTATPLPTGQAANLLSKWSRSRSELDRAVAEYHSQILRDYRAKLDELGPIGYLEERRDRAAARFGTTEEDKEAYRHLIPPPGVTVHDIEFDSSGEPQAFQPRSSQRISSFLGEMFRMPEKKEPGKPVHNALASLRERTSQLVGGAEDAGLKRKLEEQKTGAGKAIKASAVLYNSVAPGSARARALSDFSDAYADQAGKQAARYYYRYGGLTQKTGPNIVRGKDARGRKVDDSKDVSFRNRVYEDLARRLPDENAAKLSAVAGSMPPSEGYILARHGGTVMFRDPRTGSLKKVKGEGQTLYQSLGKAPDRYLPYNLTSLSGLKGGGWSLRRRTWGGLTTEDLHAGMLTGAQGVGVVSRHGVYEVQFTNLLRQSRNRMGPEHLRMLNRYEQILHAIKKGEITDERGNPIRLNHRGYSIALQALTAEFPWYLKDVRAIKASPDAIKTRSGKPLWSSDRIARDDEQDFVPRRRDEFEERFQNGAARIRAEEQRSPMAMVEGGDGVQKPSEIGSILRNDNAPSVAWRDATSVPEEMEDEGHSAMRDTLAQMHLIEPDASDEEVTAAFKEVMDSEEGQKAFTLKLLEEPDALEGDAHSRLTNEYVPDQQPSHEGDEETDRSLRRIHDVMRYRPNDITTSQVDDIRAAISSVTDKDLAEVLPETADAYRARRDALLRALRENK